MELSTHSSSLTGSSEWRTDPDPLYPRILVVSATGNVEGGLTLFSKTALIFNKTPGEALKTMEDVRLEAIWVTDDSLLNDPTYEKTTEKIKDYVGCGGTLVLCGVRSRPGDIHSPPTHPRRWLKEAMGMEWRYLNDDAPVDAVIMRFARDMIPLLWKETARSVMKAAAERGSQGYRLPQRILQWVPTKAVLPRNPPVAVELEALHGSLEKRMDVRLMPPGLYGTCKACSGWIHINNQNRLVVRLFTEDINTDVQEIVSTFILERMSEVLRYDWSQFAQMVAGFENIGEDDDISWEEWEQKVERLIAERKK